MSTVFALLFLLFAGFLVWGLISPKKLSKFANKSMSRQEAGVGFGILSVVFFVLTGVTAPKQSVDTARTTEPQTSQLQTKTPEPEQAKPIITTSDELNTIPYTSKTVQDGAIAQGISSVTTKGVNGSKTLTYEITTLDGKETSRKLVKEVVTKNPVQEITTVGTKPKVVPRSPTAAQSNCDPNYSGACVPIASDVDCSSGSGNGPAYVRGPVTVIGRDIYDLDRDGNGTGCENG